MTEITFQNNGTPLKSSKNRRGEDCNEQLERMVKSIAEDISNGNEIGGAHDWGEKTEVYSIEWITTQDHNYKAARLMVAGGGPNIWVNLQTDQVEGYWGADKRVWGFHDSIGLDDYYREEFENSIDNLKNS
jgi:hypothetical protein|tara:strand:+ start:423 stop:815 length:393 start_codon:yes stop_codon:yes gene_type:complete